MDCDLVDLNLWQSATIPTYISLDSTCLYILFLEYHHHPHLQCQNAAFMSTNSLESFKLFNMLILEACHNFLVGISTEYACHGLENQAVDAKINSLIYKLQMQLIMGFNLSSCMRIFFFFYNNKGEYYCFFCSLDLNRNSGGYKFVFIELISSNKSELDQRVSQGITFASRVTGALIRLLTIDNSLMGTV